MIRKLLLRGPRDVSMVSVSGRVLNPGEVRLRSILSGISHGTEMGHYRGTRTDVDVEFDGTLRTYVPRTADAYPMETGYEMVSVVSEVAPDVVELAVGDRVHSDVRHAEEAIVRVSEAMASDLYPLVRLPDTVTDDDAMFLSLGAVALQGVHDGRVGVGDRVAVFGLGAVGLLTVQLARLSGATAVIGVDPLPERRDLAEQSGATWTIDPSADKFGAGAVIARAVSEPHGVDVVFETSGSYAALGEAFRAAALGGRVVTGAGYWSPSGADLRLGEEFVTNRLELIASMGVGGAPHREAPRWGRQRIMSAVLELLESGALDVSRYPVLRYPFDRAAEAYELIDQSPAAAVKVALEYGPAIRN